MQLEQHQDQIQHNQNFRSLKDCSVIVELNKTIQPHTDSKSPHRIYKLHNQSYNDEHFRFQSQNVTVYNKFPNKVALDDILSSQKSNSQHNSQEQLSSKDPLDVQAPEQLKKRLKFHEFRGIEEDEKICREALQEEIQQGVLTPIPKEEALFINRTFAITKQDGRRRKNLDCRQVNKYLQCISFKGDDFKKVGNITLRGDWATVLDISSAYNHNKVLEQLQKYVAFIFDKETYKYIGMPFSLKTASYIFHKHLHPAIGLLKSRSINITDTKNQATPRKSWMDNQPQINAHPIIACPIYWMEMEFNQSHCYNARRYKKKYDQSPNQMEQIIPKKIYSQNSKLTRLIGKLVFLKPQFPRILLHLKLLYRFLNQARARQGLNSLVQLTSKLRKDLSWQLSEVRENKPQTFEVIPPQALIVKDASRREWGVTLLLNSNHIEFMSGGIWRKSRILKSSSLRELAVVRCAVCRFEGQLKQEQIHSVHLQTDNTTTSYNINRANSSRTLTHLTDTILRKMEQLNIQIRSKHIPGTTNKTADSLLRLNRVGDHSFSKKTASRAQKKSVARDAFSISWAREQQIILPSIHLIGLCLKRLLQERIQILTITAKKDRQYWWPLLLQMTVNSLNLGQTDHSLNNGTTANRKIWALTPGELLASLISGKKEENKEKTC
ncbi:MAG: hypothetical protein EZS28_012227 [Streblomastix strix]|uniref:Reverse transcriptase domain-containing protein n=1 Tax=Streblomastix strix TaxID=222440 RepID=A0A5J4WC59_9EUKA|nr:MAG: hypothetical protein EZS28_012227 [Streblomastix strix]